MVVVRCDIFDFCGYELIEKLDEKGLGWAQCLVMNRVELGIDRTFKSLVRGQDNIQAVKKFEQSHTIMEIQ